MMRKRSAPSSLPAEKEVRKPMPDNTCKTKYPIVLIHGAGFRDLKWPVYWGRIPGALEKRGAHIFYGLQDCWASTETNAREIVRRVDEIVGENDGLVSLSSARWGENFTVLRGSGRRGIRPFHGNRGSQSALIRQGPAEKQAQGHHQRKQTRQLFQNKSSPI